LYALLGLVKRYLDILSRPLEERHALATLVQTLANTVKELDSCKSVIINVRTSVRIKELLKKILNLKGLNNFLLAYSYVKYLRLLNSKTTQQDYKQLRTLAITLCSITNLLVSLANILTFANQTLTKANKSYLMSGVRQTT
jgi:hypothetical protein